MAENSLPQVASTVKDHDIIHVDFLNEETPVVLSTDVARHFQRRHSHILRDIDRLCSILPKSFREPNFGLTYHEVSCPNGATRKEKAYLLTRDAFSLLVMGMTGKAAVMWKLRYIEVFNSIERAIRENIRTDTLEETSQSQHDDIRLIWSLGPAQKRRVRAAARYRNMGLGQQSIAKLLDIDGRTVAKLLKAAALMGLLQPKQQPAPTPPALEQGNLLEVQ